MSFINFESRRKEVMQEMNRKMQLSLMAIGEKAEGYAKMACPVDTGRLRNSLTYVTAKTQSSPNTNKYQGGAADGQTDAHPSDYKPRGTAEDDSVYIGTNVEYAQYIEFLSMEHKVGRAHFLRDAATTHSDEYKKTAEAIFKAN